MRVIQARNVNDGYAQGLALLRAEGVREESRAGPVLVMPCPVTTVYEQPRQHVLLDPRRDANPFFHLFESLWMLSGRRDARWLDRFVKDFSSRFAEDDGLQHGAYGYRWRHHFDMEGGGNTFLLPDQLQTAVELLRANPVDRRVVLTMWDPVADLGVNKRDVPCNLNVMLRIRRGDVDHTGDHTEDALDLTVCCRSNDVIWGCYGANAVHFSVLQEYLAGRIGVGVGTYYQVSNNFHGYVDVLERVGQPTPLVGAYPETAQMGKDWSCWDADLTSFMEWTESEEPEDVPQEYPGNPWFHETAEPLYVAHMLWKRGERGHAYEIVCDDVAWERMAPDWRRAAREWMERRQKK